MIRILFDNCLGGNSDQAERFATPAAIVDCLGTDPVKNGIAKRASITSGRGTTRGRMGLCAPQISAYFAGWPVLRQSGEQSLSGMMSDRLGSAIQTFPYGDTLNTVPSDKESFATYSRDGVVGLDYAQNRYYSSTWGRFLSTDPYRASGGAGNPASWNRYGSVQGDPVSYADRTGLNLEFVEYCPAEFSYCPLEVGGDGEGGGGDSCIEGFYFDDVIGYCLPIASPSAGTPPHLSCRETLISTINGYISDSPLAGTASDFVSIAQSAGLNPYLLVAIAQAESQLGLTAPAGTYNAFGLLKPVVVPGKDGTPARVYKPMDFSGDGRWVGGIRAAARTVDRQFVKGNVTVAKMYNGASNAYCVGYCAPGRTTVESVFRTLGGGDPNDSFALLWPCREE